MRHYRFDPRDLFTLQERMNRLFEEAADRRGGTREDEAEIEHADWIPAADVYEDDGEYLLVLDLPASSATGWMFRSTTGASSYAASAVGGKA